MDKLTVFKTNKGRYSVRPVDWIRIWDKYGRIQESGFNHIGIFSKKEDAEFFVKMKNLEDDGKLLELPCKPGDTVYIIKKVVSFGEIGDKSNITYRIDVVRFDYWMIPKVGKTVFLTEQEAQETKEALEDGMKHE